MEKLSIITVNLNNREGLINTIESIINQTFRNFEFLIIDGGSTDGSKEVIENYAGKINYWISEPDRGIYHAMNKGVVNANGEYLLFLNSGDFLVNNHVIENVFSTDSTADILYASCNISDKGKVVHIIDSPAYITFGSIYNVGLAHQSTFIKKELFNKFGYYREDFKYHADIEFWYRTIILGGATSDKINVIVSDYNLDGISTKEKSSEVFLREHEIILSHPVIKRIVPDYKKWRELEKDFETYLWVQKKKWLLIPLKLIFKINRKFKLRANHFH